MHARFRIPLVGKVKVCVATNGAAFFGAQRPLRTFLLYRKMREVITLSDKHCKDCKNFSQHYTLDSRRIFRIHCGHCTLHPPKHKKPHTAACKNFAPGTPQEDAFISKEYLSKELLQYMLQLELLPEITEADEDLASVLIKK